MPLKLFKISAPTCGYDVYDSAVVAAHDIESARKLHPNGRLTWGSWPDKDSGSKLGYGRDQYCEDSYYGTWEHIDKVQAEYLGELDDSWPTKIPHVIVASFNAG